MQTLISELASCQSRQSVDHSTVAAATRQLSDIGGPVALVGDAMADLIEFFRASPTMWKTLPMRYFKSIAADGCSLYSVEEPLQSLCRLQSKIGMWLQNTSLAQLHALTCHYRPGIFSFHRNSSNHWTLLLHSACWLFRVTSVPHSEGIRRCASQYNNVFTFRVRPSNPALIWEDP